MKPIKSVKFAKGRDLNKQQKKEPTEVPQVESDEDDDVGSDKDSVSLESQDDDMSAILDDEDDQEDAGEADGDDEDEQDDDDDDDDDDDGHQDQPKEVKMSSEEKKQARKEQREKRKFDFERNERTIFVGNLPSSMEHRDVAKLFKKCGPVESARIRSIVPEKEKLSPKVAIITQRMHPKVDSVNAYVVFAKTESGDCIKKALAMNGTVIKDHHIRVDRAQHPNSKRLTLTSRKKSIFVGNLRFDLRDDDLIAHFQKAGEVDYVRIVRDRATGLGKGFGFVKFLERAAVKKALEMNDSNFKGRLLRVKKVDDKMKMDDSAKKQPQPQKSFDKPVNQKRFERAQQHGKMQGKQVQFNLKSNNPNPNPNNKNNNTTNQQRDQAQEPQTNPAVKFQKVMMTKKVNKKKKTILKKKMNKNRQIKG